MKFFLYFFPNQFLQQKKNKIFSAAFWSKKIRRRLVKGVLLPPNRASYQSSDGAL